MDPFPGRPSDLEALIIKVAYPSVVNPGQMAELWDRMGEVAPIPIREDDLPKMSVRLVDRWLKDGLVRRSFRFRDHILDNIWKTVLLQFQLLREIPRPQLSYPASSFKIVFSNGSQEVHRV